MRRLKSDIGELERQGVKGAYFLIESEPNSRGDLEIRSSEGTGVVYTIVKGTEEYQQMKNQIRGSWAYTVRRNGPKMELYDNASARAVMSWEIQVPIKGGLNNRGIRDNEGRIIRNIEELPILPIVIAEMTGSDLRVLRDKRTKRLEYWVMLGSKVVPGRGICINQRGERALEFLVCAKNPNKEEIIKRCSVEEFREVMKKAGIQHSTRNAKKELREIAGEMRVAITVRTVLESTNEVIVPIKVYEEAQGRVIIRTKETVRSIESERIVNIR